MPKTDRQIAEEHWEYTVGIIERTPVAVTHIPCTDNDLTDFQKWIPLMKYLYIEGMIHGIKHGEERANG